MKKQEIKKTYKRGQHPNSKANLEKITADKQPSGEAKSKGQIQKRKEINVIYNAETLFEKRDILPQLIDNIKNQVDMGINKDALDLMKLFKKNENSTNINVQGVQKVFVTQEEINEVDKHIQEFINND